MSTKRLYDDLCGVARALDLVGQRWALLVVRELLLGAKRFTDLQTDLAGISSNVLTSRLEELEASGIVHRRRLAPPASSVVYELTAWGERLDPIVCGLAYWAFQEPGGPRGNHVSATSMALSMRTTFDPSAAAHGSGRFVLELGQERFHADVADAGFTIERAYDGVGTGAMSRDGGVDATIRTLPLTLASLVYGGRDLDETLRSGEVELDGDPTSVTWFLRMFALPDPAT